MRSKIILKIKNFFVVKQLHEPNVYQNKPVSGVGPEWVVNCRQMQDLQNAHDISDNTGDKEVGNIPSFNPKRKLKETPNTHKYATQAKE